MAQLIYSWLKSSLVFHLRSSRLQTFSIDFLRLRGNSLKILKYTHPFSLWNCLNALNLFIRLMRSPYWQVLGWQTRHQYKRLWFFMLETLVSHAETAELIEMSSGRFWRPKRSQIPPQNEILGGYCLACPDSTWSIFATLFTRWQQQCGLCLPLL